MEYIIVQCSAGTAAHVRFYDLLEFNAHGHKFFYLYLWDNDSGRSRIPSGTWLMDESVEFYSRSLAASGCMMRKNARVSRVGYK